MNSATSGSRKHCKMSTDMMMDLPLNLIQQILERLPLQDAARMSVLSKDWRYIWLSLPHIILDLKFSEAIQKQNAILDFQYRYSNTISKILIRHRGDIHKFVLDVPSQLPISTDIDTWIEFVCQHGVKDLCVKDHRLTKLKPLSCLFLCESLTNLTLHCGSLSLPSTYGGFPCLVSLTLYTSEDNNVKLETLIRNCPQLTSLGLFLSKATTHSLTIHSSKLQYLAVAGVNNTLILKEPERIRTVGLSIQGGNMVDLLRRMPSLEVFCLTNFRGCKVKPPKSLAMPLKQLYKVKLSMSLTCQYNISLLLCLFKSCPRLSTLQITALTCKSCVDNVPEFDVSCSLEPLKWVKFLCFSGSSSELHLVKFLLAQAPALELMTIVLDASVNRVSDAKFELAMAVTRFRRASANAEVLLKT